MGIDGLFRRMSKFMGGYAGVDFDIYRPNYNQIDNTPVLVYPSQKYLMNPASPMYSEPKYRDVEWYDIAGDRNIVLPGDLFIKSVPDGGMTPIVTMGTVMDNKNFTGYRTNRTCDILNSTNDIIYQNVYFEFIDIGYPGSSINKNLENSLRIPNNRLVIFNRDGIFRYRTQIVETDSTQSISKDGGTPIQFQRKWMVEEIDHTGNFMVLTVRNALEQ